MAGDLIQVSPLGSYARRLGVEVKLNPSWAEAAEATRESARRLAIFRDPGDELRYDRARFIELSAGSYPSASPAVLQVAERWHYWLFSFDDRTDESDGDLARDVERHQRLVSELIRMLEDGNPAGADPHARFLAEVLEELRALASPRVYARFRGHVRDYLLHGSMPGAFNWMRREVPTFEEFIPQRLQEGAVNTILPLVELAEGIDLPDEFLAHPLVRRVEELANLVIALTNDLFSYEKEVTRNQNPNNLLYVIAQHRGLRLSDSVLWALGLLDGYLDEYARLCKLFEGQDELSRYLHGLSTWICASQKWYLDSGRYSGVDQSDRLAG